MIKHTMWKALWLSFALSASGCGSDSAAGAAPAGGGGTGYKPPADEDGGTENLFPNDKSGPVVTFTSPVGMDDKPVIVGGKVVVTMTITDEPAGIASKDENLFASIESQGKTVRLDVKPLDGEFTVTFQAEDFEQTADITLNVHAEDSVGNVTIASYLMLLDTVPPWISLDPPALRKASREMADEGPYIECSAPFDPLGESPKDGEVVLQESRIRAFVWERALQFPGATEVYYAGVNEDEVKLFLQNDPKKPLLTDSDDEDDFCDTVQEAAAVRSIQLNPVESGGEPEVGRNTDSQQPDIDGVCVTGPPPDEELPDPPEPLCLSTELTYVTAQNIDEFPTAVYGFQVSASGVGCTGTSWDSQTAGGWTCVVARTWDQAGPNGKGNIAFSVPIRVCRKLKDTDCNGAAEGDILTPPKGLTCTDGCKLPPEVTRWGHSPIVLYEE